LHFGDPTFAGWLIVFAYFLVVFRCYSQYMQAKKQGVEAHFWLIVGGFLFLLGLNKQLDLQTIFEVSMRDLAISHGWYAQRRLMQFAFVGLLAAGLIILMIILRGFLAKSWQENKVVCFGLFLIAVFIVLRAAAFNHFSYLSTQSYWGFNAHALLELGALCVIFYGTSVSGQRPRRITQQHHNTQSALQHSEVFCVAEGSDVYCPQCNTKAVSKAVNQRTFKCKVCATIYTVHIR
jgi:glucan phosphoethanolaminetransferase (alkaline phosphatase superfamily)